MNNPQWLEMFIEDEGFTPIAEDQYECAGGHVWHIDEIKDLWHQTINEGHRPFERRS
jgi:hypothetical protein